MPSLCDVLYKKSLCSQAGVLVSYALTNFKHAIENLKKHEQNDYPKEAAVKTESFVKVTSGQQDSFSVKINNAITKELVARNRKKVQSIINPQHMREGYSSHPVCVSVCLLPS